VITKNSSNSKQASN